MKLFTRSLLIIFAFLFLFGCAAKQMSTPAFEAKQFDKSMYTAKADNILFIFDASSSMSADDKFTTAQAVVKAMNDTIPELGQTAGVRSFGHAPSVSKMKTELFYGMEKYLTHNLENSFEKISKPGGTSPLYLALDAAIGDLKDLPGNTAVVIISDGIGLPGNPGASAQALKGEYGASVCFYPILVGSPSESVVASAKELAKLGGCGFYSHADDLLSPAAMASFVEKAFLAKKDAPAPAPAPAPMKKDSDKDGVYDDEDQCPDTPVGAKVNVVGCWVLDTVLFDFNKDVIKAEAYPLLDDVAVILEKNPAMSVDLQGHCDNVGTPDYNMDLSLRRARAVKAYLTDKGIRENRMTTEGFGFTKPVALNGTEAGRALNRRVEISPF